MNLCAKNKRRCLRSGMNKFRKVSGSHLKTSRYSHIQQEPVSTTHELVLIDAFCVITDKLRMKDMLTYRL